MTDIAKVYGGALYELAAEEGKDGEMLAQLGEVCALLRRYPEYEKLLCLPNVPKAERCQALDGALRGQVDPYLLNFLKILCENGTVRQLPGCAREFRSRYNAAHGIVEAKAVCAVALGEDTKARLVRRLQDMTGKTVDLTVQVDPACLGGIRLEMEGKQLDGTVQGRLAQLRRDLENIVL